MEEGGKINPPDGNKKKRRVTRTIKRTILVKKKNTKDGETQTTVPLKEGTVRVLDEVNTMLEKEGQGPDEEEEWDQWTMVEEETGKNGNESKNASKMEALEGEKPNQGGSQNAESSTDTIEQGEENAQETKGEEQGKKTSELQRQILGGA